MENEVQKFYCKKCGKEFEIIEKDHYYNYKCPVCGIMCQHKGYIGIMFSI